MSVNSSVDSQFVSTMYCLLTRPFSLIYISFFVTNILLLLPLCGFVLYLGLQQRRRQSSASAAAVSHTDSFTYHLVAMEMIGLFGFILCCCGIHWSHSFTLLVGFCLWYFIWYGEMLFHVLTCVERYLAVVRPVTYLSLRGERAIRARNVSIGCVWLFSLGGPCLMTLEEVITIMNLLLLVSSLAVISFCSLSVLCALIRPGPGEGGGDRKKVDQSKRRAFYTIVAILSVLLLRFFWNLTWHIIKKSKGVDCLPMSSGIWLNLPTSLVLPLLFLHRAQTSICCKNAN